MSNYASGRFSISVERHTDNGVEIIELIPEQNNLAMTAASDLLIDREPENFYLGTGNTPPAVTDTELSGTPSVVQSTKATVYQAGNEYEESTDCRPEWIVGDDNYYLKAVLIKSASWSFGILEGNWSEIGVFAISGQLLYRSLLKDEFGDPTTVTILATDVVTLTYTFTAYHSAFEPYTGSFVYDTNTYNFTIYDGGVEHAPPDYYRWNIYSLRNSFGYEIHLNSNNPVISLWDFGGTAVFGTDSDKNSHSRIQKIVSGTSNGSMSGYQIQNFNEGYTSTVTNLGGGRIRLRFTITEARWTVSSISWVDVLRFSLPNHHYVYFSISPAIPADTQNGYFEFEFEFDYAVPTATPLELV